LFTSGLSTIFNHFNLAKTSDETGISVDSLRRWRDAMRTNVFTKVARPDIIQKTVNAFAKQEVVKTNLKTEKYKLAVLVAKLIKARLESENGTDLIQTRDLIAIIKLDEQKESDPESDVDILKKTIDKWKEFEREKKRNNAEDAEIV